MKVLLVLGGVEEGGLEKHVVELANALAGRAEVLVAAHPRYAARFGPAVRFLPMRLDRSRSDPRLLWEYYRTVRRERPDVIHAHGAKATALVTRLRGATGVPLVASVHGIKKRQGYLDGVDHVIAVSRRVAASVGDRPCSLVYNGVDVPPLPPRVAVAASPAQARVLAVGRLVEAKGFEVLLEAWRAVPARLTLVGDGPLRDALQRQAAAAGVADRVDFLGQRDDVWTLLRAHDLLVISSHQEGFSYVFIESLLAGTPVVSTAVGVMPEVLPASDLVPPGDAPALAAAVNAALADLPAFTARHAETFAFAAREFTLAAMVDHVLAVYAAVARGPAP